MSKHINLLKINNSTYLSWITALVANSSIYSNKSNVCLKKKQESVLYKFYLEFNICIIVDSCIEILNLKIFYLMPMDILKLLILDLPNLMPINLILFVEVSNIWLQKSLEAKDTKTKLIFIALELYFMKCSLGILLSMIQTQLKNNQKQESSMIKSNFHKEYT